MNKLFLDIESFCETPITSGTYKYSEKAEVLIVTWAVDDGEVDFWDVTADKTLPKRLYQVMMDQKTTIVIHNSNFDRTVIKAALGIDLATRRIHDTMVQALEHGLPGSLGTLCEIFGIQSDKAKDKDGRRLINLFCKYLPANQKLRRATRETHPADWQKFIDYAKTDIKAMRELYRKIPNWNYKGVERDLWILDQKINDRGMLVDVEFAKKAIELVDSTQAELSRQTYAVTDGEVKSTNQRDELLAYILKEYGVELPNMQKSTVERRLNDPELPDGVKELLLLRTQASTSSTAKYKKLIACVSNDNRLRGTMQFCGASRTGRVAHRQWQPGNLPRPQYKSADIDMFISAVKADCADLIFDDIMKYTSSALRGCIIAPEGKKLVVSDLSNIEGRIAAWLSNEEWKIKAFEDFDKGIGEDLYKLAYAKAFGKNPEDVTKDERQIGKCLELSMGYAGGVGAFLTFATAYSLNLDDMAQKMLPTIDRKVMKEASEFHDYLIKHKASTCGLKKDTFIFCDCLKRLWREAHPNISAMWGELEEAVRNAVNIPNKVFKVKRLSVEKRGNWLYMALPSGRLLCYPSMKIKDGKLVFKGVNQYSRKWGEIGTFSGKLFENCLSADTKVLTENGWLSIVEVTKGIKVWDGTEWVEHEGVKLMGSKHIMRLGGVGITPTHKVLTAKGWVYAKDTSYEEATNYFSRYHKSPLWYDNSNKIRRQRRKEICMGDEMRLRQSVSTRLIGVLKRETKVLWLLTQQTYWQKQYQTQSIFSSGVLDMEIYEAKMSEPKTQSLEELWRSRNHCVPKMAGRSGKLLGRHERQLSNWFNFGKNRQQQRLLQRKLQMGNSNFASKKCENESDCRYSVRENVVVRSFRDIWYKTKHFGFQNRERMSCGKTVHTSELHQPVYDIINCGKNNRFTICGTDGRPFIVHNCCQSFARDVMFHALPKIEAAGYLNLVSIHDEVITEAPDTEEYTAEHLSELLSTNPAWSTGLPLAAGGFECKRYRKE